VHNKEFVAALGAELKKLGGKIIEICAGDGKLAYQLRKIGVGVLASDDYSLKMDRKEDIVEKLSHKEAMKKYAPDVILVSWPNKMQIIHDARGFNGVKHILYIGEEKEGLLPKTGWSVRRLAGVERYIIERSDRNAEAEKRSVAYLFSTASATNSGFERSSNAAHGKALGVTPQRKLYKVNNC
jgi:hypothetical protein